MKKLLSVLLVLLAIPVGIFFYKGGHHALALAEKMADWLDAPAADQTISLTVDGQSLNADLFWMPGDDDRIWGMEEYGIYLQDDTLYLDNGRAYALPELRANNDLRRLVWGLLAYGRVTREGNTWYLDTDSDQFSLHGTFTAGDALEAAQLEARLPWQGRTVNVAGALTVQRAQAHALPQKVALAMEDDGPHVSLSQPLNAILPAVEQLDHLTADANFGVACGILNLTESAQVTLENGTVTLSRSGVEYKLSLPLTELSPVLAGLAVLKHGEFRQSGAETSFRFDLPPEEAAEVCAQLVPQLSELGVTFDTATAEIAILSERLQTITLSAAGNIPFVITEIPIAFTAEFHITNNP